MMIGVQNIGAHRPGPLRWLRYAFGRPLPAKYREWVLHDLTVDTWWLRQLIRSLVQVLPFGIALALLLPVEPWIRITAVLGGMAVGMIYAVALLPETSESRAIKAGYPRGYIVRVREEAHADERAAAQRRYEQRYRNTGDA
jgi:hypothetical protein